VPDDTNVLINHGPPFGILDRSPFQQQHQGDPELLARCGELPHLRFVCFGHIHGTSDEGAGGSGNAEPLGRGGGLEHEPVVLRMSQLGLESV
jgi:hypothetical protein